MINKLKIGKQYHFQFTHKKNVYGIVCEVNEERKWFAIYDIKEKQYENIPYFRLKSFEQA
jgi:hypothetical protein